MTCLIEFEKNSIEHAISEIFDSYTYGKPGIKLLKSIEIISEDSGYRAFLIGGFPRDIFIYLMKSNHKTSQRFKSAEIFRQYSEGLDLDIAVEGNAEKLAYLIKENNNSIFRLNSLKIHKKFGTALIEFISGNLPLKLDIASFRTEIYKKSGALPEVNTERTTLEMDILRRDFTINTIAFSLNKKDFLAVNDYSCGLKDIFNKKIRILHEASFIDDPTRIIRAVRFEKRLGFKIERKTFALMKTALDDNVMGNVSGKRIMAELYLLLKEKNPEIYFERLEKLNILSKIYEKLKFDNKNKTVFKKVSSYFNNHEKIVKLTGVCRDIDADLFYLAGFFNGLSKEELREAIKRLNLGNRIENMLLSIYSDADKLNSLKNNNFFKLKLKNSEIYKKFNKLDIKGIMFYLFEDTGESILDLNFRKIIIKYLDRIIFIKPFVGGADIKSIGIMEGFLFGKILEEIKLLKIDGTLKTKTEELNYIKRKYLKNKTTEAKNDRI